MTVNEMINRIEYLDNTISNLEKIEADRDAMNTIENAVCIIDDYKDMLLAKKIAL